MENKTFGGPTIPKFSARIGDRVVLVKDVQGRDLIECIDGSHHERMYPAGTVGAIIGQFGMCDDLVSILGMNSLIDVNEMEMDRLCSIMSVVDPDLDDQRFIVVFEDEYEECNYPNTISNGDTLFSVINEIGNDYQIKFTNCSTRRSSPGTITLAAPLSMSIDHIGMTAVFSTDYGNQDDLEETESGIRTYYPTEESMSGAKMITETEED